MKGPMMCPTHSCPRHGEKRTVLGGCEDCGAQLVAWEDPNKPTIEELAALACTVSLFEGRVVPMEIAEKIMRDSPTVRNMWEGRYLEQRGIAQGISRYVTDKQWLKAIEKVKNTDGWSITYPKKEGDPVYMLDDDVGEYHIIEADGSVRSGVLR